MPADATVNREYRDRRDRQVRPIHFQSERFLPEALHQQPLQVILPIRLLILFCLKATRETRELPVLPEHPDPPIRLP